MCYYFQELIIKQVYFQLFSLRLLMSDREVNHEYFGKTLKYFSMLKLELKHSM